MASVLFGIVALDEDGLVLERLELPIRNGIDLNSASAFGFVEDEHILTVVQLQHQHRDSPLSRSRESLEVNRLRVLRHVE